MFANQIKAFYDDESGQGITEYGAIVAFVGVIVAMVFSAGNGTLALSIKNTFSAVANDMNQIAANAS